MPCPVSRLRVGHATLLLPSAPLGVRRPALGAAAALGVPGGVAVVVLAAWPSGPPLRLGRKQAERDAAEEEWLRLELLREELEGT